MQESSWTPTPRHHFFSRNDQQDIRWGDRSQSLDPQENSTPPSRPSLGLWGYADDEGIALNGGRRGARYAPDDIRRYFYRLTPVKINPTLNLGDYGNWGQAPTLLSHIEKISPVLATHLLKHPMITLGGGHDFGAVDGAGFLQWHQQTQASTKPLIINFDAHLDVRPWKAGLNSGTPFSWLLAHYPQQFEFMEVGIQKHCASPHHLQWVLDQGAKLISSDSIQRVGLLTALLQELAGTSLSQPCYISLDIDVFAQSLAPGCSQSWEAGLHYTEMIEALRWLITHKKVQLLGIYEVSPPLDQDHRTSKLAAMLMNEFICHRFPY